MNMRSTRMLFIVAALLVVGVIVLDLAGDGGERTGSTVLLPELDGRINDVTSVALTYPEATVTIAKSGSAWLVEEKDGYAADTGTLRQALIALRDADKLERKTANPEMHERLGLLDPGAEGSGSIGMTIRGDGFEHALVIGDVAQQEYRYVRFAGEDQTWLIDRNPEVPDDATGWLAPDLVEVPSSDVQAVSIVHADGEAIHFAKSTREDAAYTVADIPEGRELTYPGVVNGIAGALGNLDLDEVRRPPGELPEPATTSTWTTFEGLRVTATRYEIDDASWISLAAEATEPPVADEPVGGDDAGDDAAADAETQGADGEAVEPPADDGESPVAARDEADAGDAVDEEPQITPERQATDINATVSGWLYQVPDHKLRLMQRRWDDILKAPPAAADDAE